MAISFPPPPTYAEVWITNPQGVPSFNPIWLNWFVQLAAAFTGGGGGGGVVHNALGGLQGGGTGEYYHLTNAQAGAFSAIPITPPYGGTGIGSYTIGDLLYASGATTLSKLAAGTANYVLTSGGIGVAPAWAVDAPEVGSILYLYYNEGGF